MKRGIFGGVLLLVVLGVACSGKSRADQAANSPLEVVTSQMFLTIRNTVGVPLTEVTIAILPVGRQTEFTKYFSRIESSEKRDIVLTEFFGKDGTPFNVRFIKPSAIRITAKDLTGKSYEAELDW
jgi:hypothetical protein